MASPIQESNPSNKIPRVIFKNLAALSLSYFAAKLIAFGGVWYLARTLLPEGFGKISFATAILLYFSLLVDFGLTILGTRNISQNPDNIKKQVSQIQSLRFFLSLFAFLFMALLSWFIHKPFDIKQLILIYGISLFALGANLRWVFQGIQKMTIIGISETLGIAVYFTLVLIFIHSPSDILKIPWIYLVGCVLTTGILILKYLREGHSFSFIPSALNSISILQEALPMGLSGIFIQVYYNLDTIMLGFMRTNQEVGWYSAQYRIVLLFQGFAVVIGTVIFPVISRLYQESREKLTRFTAICARYLILFSVPLSVGGTVLAKPIITLLYGTKYQPGVPAFQILIWTIATVFSNAAFGYLLLASGRQKQYMYASVTGAGVNFIFNLLLIPKFGIIGAGTATMITEVTVLLYLYMSAQSVAQVPVLKYYFQAGLAAAVMAGVIIYFNLTLLVSIAVGILVYGLTLVLLRSITIEDFRILRSYIAG